MSKVFLFFSPFMAVWDHVIPELHVAKALEERGHTVIYLGCRGLYERQCVAMSGYGLSESSPIDQKRKICELCSHRRTQVLMSGRKLYFLDDFLSPADFEQTDRLVKSMSVQQILSFQFQGIPIGKVSLYEYLLHAKKKDLIFSELETEHCRIHFRNSLLTATAFQKFYSGISFDQVMMYNTLYSVNAVITKLTQALSKPVYFLHHGLSLADRNHKIIFGQNATVDFLKATSNFWSERPGQVPTADQYASITNHFLELIRGTSPFAYSAAVNSQGNIPQTLRIPQGKKVVVVSMSSGDERLAAEVTGWVPVYPRLFPTQVEWVQFLLKWARGRHDVHLIFRVHPREFPNKRDSVLSEQAKALQTLLQNLPENVVVNWPEQKISLYDLAEYVDCFLNAWSSVGKEMAQLGFPVVIYSKDLIWYPADLNYIGSTEAEYLEAIDRALAKGWSIEHSMKVYHWLNYELNLSHLDLKQKIRIPHKNGDLIQKLLKRISVGLSTRYDLWNIDSQSLSLQIDQMVSQKLSTPLQLTKNATTISEENQVNLLKREFKKILQQLYPEGKSVRDNGLYAKMKTFIGDA